MIQAKGKHAGGQSETKGKGTNTNANHKANGDFAKGNKASKGHSTKEQDKGRDFKRIFQQTVTHADMTKIAKKLIKLAIAGDVKAAKEVLDRCMGKAEQGVNIVGKIGVEHTFPKEILDVAKKMAESFAQEVE